MSQKTIAIGTAGVPVNLDTNFGNAQDNFTELYSDKTTQDAAIALNTAKTGITTAQANAITANTAKVGITTEQANAIIANTAKVSFDATSSSRLASTSGANTGDQDLSGKQDTLVSATNIKTINGVSILGPGDLAVEGGAGTDDQTATEVAFTPYGTIASTNVQAAIQELVDEKAESSNTAFVASELADLAILTLDAPVVGSPLVNDTVNYDAIDDHLRVWSIERVGSELATKTSVANINDLSDVDTTGAADGSILKHNGTSWVVGVDAGESGGISHAVSDGNYYASLNGAWASLTGLYAPALTADENYVTDDQILALDNAQPDLGVTGLAGIRLVEETALGLRGLYNPGTWKILYTDGDENGIKELSLGTMGSVLQSNGTGGAPSFVAVAKPIASGAQALGILEIADNACAALITVSATGVLATDIVDIGYNSTPIGKTGYDPTAAELSIRAFPTADNINILVCNRTGAAVIPAAMTVNWRVVR